MSQNLFIIGDTHGRFPEVKKLINKIDTNETRVIFTGDLIDRGKEGRKIINFVRDNNFECVIGNHEIMFIEQKYLIKSLVDIKKSKLTYKQALFEIENILFAISKSFWFSCGGRNFFTEYGDDYEAMLVDLEFLESLPIYIKTDVFDSKQRNCVVSHSCILPLLDTDTKLKELKKDPESVYWPKFKSKDIFNKSKFFNVFGHIPVDVFNSVNKSEKISPYIDESIGFANVDTGACYDRDFRGYLSGIFFPSLEVLSVKSDFAKK